MIKPANARNKVICLSAIKQFLLSMKSLKNSLFVCLITTVLVACTGEQQTLQPDQTPDPGNAQQSPDQNPQPNEQQYTVIDFDFAQLSQNHQYRSNQVQTRQFTNGTGQFRLPLGNQSLTGNITIAIDAQDPEGIESIIVGFQNTEQAIEVCRNNCNNPHNQTITGVNPLDFNLPSGQNRLQMSIKDTQGNQVTVINVDFDWQPTIINGLNAQRSTGNIDFSWQPLSNYLRYNLYIANQNGVNADNYQTLEGGQAFFAITDPSYTLTTINDNQAIFATITGVDGSGESAFGEQIKVPALSGLNDQPPMANNDEYQLNEDTTFSANFLDNDSDDNASSLTASTEPVTATTNGSVTINTDGTFSYTPSADFYGTDQFQYQVFDNLLQATTGTVVLNIDPINDAPQALDITFNATTSQTRTINGQTIKTQVSKAGVLTVPAPGILINDIDIDNPNASGLSVDTQAIIQPTQGSLTLNGDGSFSYTPNDNASGSDSFTYRAIDETGGADNATVTLHIDAQNFAPIAATDTYTTTQGVTMVVDNSSGTRLAILHNDNDSDPNDSLSLNTEIMTTPRHGSLNIDEQGLFTYIPNAGFYGIDFFIYEITDSQGNTAQAPVKLIINQTNSAPTPVNDNYQLDEDTTLNIAASNGLLNNDSDPEGDDIRVDPNLVHPPSNGTVNISENGSFSYTPNNNFFGSDTFRYTLLDINNLSSQASVTLTINNVNDAPIATDDVAQTDENQAVSIDVLANDSDIENDTLTVITAVVAAQNQGTVVINTDNTLTYTPASNFSGTSNINYQISDNQGATANAIVMVNVNNNNQAPIATDDNYSLNEDQALNADGTSRPLLIANDSDSDNDTLTISTTAISNVANGTLILNSNGSFSYQPNSNFFGQDSFVYQLLDSQGGTDNATVTLTVNAINDAPIAHDDSSETAEETLVNINVLTNDTDIENDSLSVIQAGALHGDVAILSDNSLNYTPEQDFVGTDTLNYQISDGQGGNSAAQVIITVSNVNDAPIAQNDQVQTDENVALTINVLANDSDIDGDQLTVMSATASLGTVNIQSNQQLLYTPNDNINGEDTINYTISDGQGGTASAQVFITIIAQNSAPDAQNDTANIDEDNDTTINVLLNDTDPDGDLLSITQASANSGTVTINFDNTLQYQPQNNFFGQDTINYSIEDNQGLSDSAIVTVNIASVNDNPIANPDSISTDEGRLINIDVLANDTDVDNDTLTIVQASAQLGAVTFVDGLSINYQGPANANGSDTISYQISDGQGGSASSTVAVTLTTRNDPPIAVDDNATTDEDTAINIDVLSNDSDPDNDTISLVSASAINGTIAINSDQTLAYQPNDNYFGSDTIIYTITDGNSTTASASVFVTITAVNDNPMAISDTATTDEDNPITINVLANDSDVDNDALTITAGAADNGQVNVNGNNISYSPNADFYGNDTIIYNITDGKGGRDSTTVSVTVNPINDNPIAQNDQLNANEDQTYIFNALANDSDADNDPLSIVSITADKGQISVNSDQTLTYVPIENFSGEVSMFYTITDGQTFASATVNLTVNPVNDLPIVINETLTLNEDQSGEIDVLANDSDIDSSNLTLQSASAENGTSEIITSSAQNRAIISYSPNNNYFGQDTITYTVADEQGGTTEGQVFVTIEPQSDIPIALNDSANIDEDTQVTIDVLANDSEPDGQTLTLISAVASNGQVTINANNSLTYNPNAHYFGSDNISYTISDGDANSTASAIVSITINSINDTPIANSDIATTGEESSVLIDALANDSDPDNDILSITSATAISGSALIRNNQIRYTPNQDFSGNDTISYVIEDPSGASASSTIEMVVTNNPDRPTANPDSISLDEDTSISFDPKQNDTDPDGDALTITQASVDLGTVAININGGLDYTPESNFNGSAVINYTISDPSALTASSTVAITVNAVNDIPVAQNETITLLEDTLTSIDILANDSDTDGDTLIIQSATSNQGQVEIIAIPHSLSFTPQEHFNGNGQIDYTISDGNGGTTNASVFLTITAVNDAPIAIADNMNTNEDTNITFNPLSNDSDVENHTISLVSATLNNPSNGTLTTGTNGELTFAPNANFFGVQTISYTIKDSLEATALSFITLTVVSVNDTPVANNDTAIGDEDTNIAVNVLANDTDIENDPLTISNITANHGNVSIQNANSLIYTPELHFFGQDTINYTITDPSGASDNATVAVTINSVNDAPNTQPDNATVDEDNPVTIDVLANDTDIEGDSFTVITAIAPNGAITIEPDSRITYLPNANYNGLDTITYHVNDSGNAISQGTVNITINSINDAPTPNPDILSGFEDTPIALDVLANDIDVDGDTILIAEASTDNGGIANISGTRLQLNPPQDFVGVINVGYTIKDPSGETGSSTVTVTVNNVNDAPIAVFDTAVTSQGTRINIPVLQNDTDIDGDTIRISGAVANNGQIDIINNTSIDYTPNASFLGDDTISYSINDGNGGIASTNVTVTVNTVVNTQPVANSDTASTVEDSSAININIIANDTDADGDALTVTIASAVNGTASIETDQSLNYTPNADFNGTDTINYTISDGKDGTASSNVTVTVDPVNDAPILTPRTASVAENSANSLPIISMVGTDVDGDILNYAIDSGNNDNIFAINSSGLITINDNTNLNFELAEQHLLTVSVTDPSNATASNTATINVTNVIEPVTPVLDSSFGGAGNSGTAGSNAFAAKLNDYPGAAILQGDKFLVASGNGDGNKILVLSRFNADGSIDRTFGYKGITTTDMFNDATAEEQPIAIALDANGNIVVAGNHKVSGNEYPFTARFNANGMLDTSFNSIGYHIYAEEGPMTASDMKIHPTGVILLSAHKDGDLALINFSADGFNHTFLSVDIAGNTDLSSAINIQSDGKVLVSGSALSSVNGFDFAIARFSVATGSPNIFLDASYNATGFITHNLGSAADLAIDAALGNNDELILAGATQLASSQFDVAAIRIDANGQLLSSFGNSGQLIIDIDGDGSTGSNSSSALRINTDANDNIYYAINIGQTGTGITDAVIYKTDNQGTPDSSFTASGQQSGLSATFDMDNADNLAAGLDIDANGKVTLLSDTKPGTTTDIAIARFQSDGTLDNSFDNDGKNRLDANFSTDELKEIIELQVAPHAGKFVAVGYANANILIAARYQADGQLDATFGENGYFQLQTDNVDYQGHDIIEQSDGKLAIAGLQKTSSLTSGLVVKLNPDGQLDNSFGTNGIVTHTGGSELKFYAIAIDNSGNLIVAGSNDNTNKDVFLMRLTGAAGTPDAGFGGDGTANIDLGQDEQILDITTITGGAILATGVRGSEGLVIKIKNDGSLSSDDFGSGNGYIALDLDPLSSTNVDTLRKIVTRPDNRIVLAGHTEDSQAANILVQLNGNGTPDTTFDSDAIVSHNYGNGDAKTLALALDANNNILISGYNSNNGSKDIFVARVTATGTKDTDFNGNDGAILFDYGQDESTSALLVKADGSLIIAGSDNLNMFPTAFFFVQQVLLNEQ